MQTLTNADIADTESLHFLKDLSPRERIARQFLINSFTGKMPSLIPLALENESVVKLASVLLRSTSGSKYTAYQYVFGIHRFSDYLDKKPDMMIQDVADNQENLKKYAERLEEFAGDLQAEGLAYGTIANHVKGVKAHFRANGIEIMSARAF